MRSAIILAGGRSSRIGRDKALEYLDQRTIIEHICERVSDAVEEVVISVGSEIQRESHSRVLGACTFAVDEEFHGSPLAGLYSGLKKTRGDMVAVVGCDMPFASKTLFNILFELCDHHGAAIPRWTNGDIEPLHSVYETRRCLAAAKKTLERDHREMRAMISNISDVQYLSTEAIVELGLDLLMFTNINTESDLRKFGRLLRRAADEDEARVHIGTGACRIARA